MMTLDDALQPTLARLRAGYATSPLPAFFAWWGDGLRACLPERWQALLRDHIETLLVGYSDSGLDVYYASRPGEPPVASAPARLSAEEKRLTVNEVRAELHDARARTQFCLDRRRVLVRTMHLPVAAEHNLSQVLGFEMDRQTPFKMDEVYLDYRIVGRDKAKKTIEVELAVIPRHVLDAELEKLEPLQLALDGIDAWVDAPGGERLGFNFLPVSMRVKRHNKRLWLNLGLAALAVALLVWAMNLWVANREQALEDMRAEVAEIQKQAKQVSMLRKGLVESIKGASFLIRKKNDFPSRINLLADVTRTLDDQTYLQRLTIDTEDRLSLQGMSDHAASLLGEVAAIPELDNPSFQGPIRPDRRSGKDMFNIMANIVPAPEDVDADKPEARPAGAATVMTDAAASPAVEGKQATAETATEAARAASANAAGARPDEAGGDNAANAEPPRDGSNGGMR